MKDMPMDMDDMHKGMMYMDNNDEDDEDKVE